MGQTTFGFGDTTGHNNFAFAGAGTASNNEWENQSWGTGQFGRIVALAARWSGYTSGVGIGSCSNPSGVSNMWTGNNNGVLSSGSYGAGTVSSGGAIAQLNNSGTADFWQNNNSYFLGFRTGGCLYFHGTTNSGNYSGNGDGTGPGGGANCWGGTGCFGFGTFGTVQVTLVFVKRGGVWTQARVYVKRGGVWGTAYVQVKRTGAFTGVLNMAEWLQESERHIPEKGMPVEVNVGEGWEPGWIVETGEYAWFGSYDPTTLGVDWWKPGHYHAPNVFTGRYNSAEPEEVVEARLQAYYEWDKALRWENYKEANFWYQRFQPGSLPILEKKSTNVPEINKPVFDEPEPILVPCGCA